MVSVHGVCWCDKCVRDILLPGVVGDSKLENNIKGLMLVPQAQVKKKSRNSFKISLEISEWRTWSCTIFLLLNDVYTHTTFS